MKTIFRIPMQDPYAYIEFEAEEDTFLSAYGKYQQTMSIVKGESGIGIPDKDFNTVYDTYRKTGKFNYSADYWVTFSKDQQTAMNALKLSLKRSEEFKS